MTVDTLDRHLRRSPRLAEVTTPLLAGADDLAPVPGWFPDAPGAQLVPLAHDGHDCSGTGLHDGRTFTLSASFGVVRLATTDLVRGEATAERLRETERKIADLDAALAALDQRPREPGTGGVVREWSPKSRRRMLATIAALDWTPSRVCYCGGILDGALPCCPDPTPLPHGMVTLTYPGDWLRVAPTGAVVKAHLFAFRRAWARSFGFVPVGLWKLEFQRRGAPHVHLYLPVPAATRDGECFETWLSRTWAGIVRRYAEEHLDGMAADEHDRHLVAGTGLDFATAARMGDVKRLALYFLGHSAKTRDGKEYQHVVPEAWQEPGNGPGRFWGYWGLRQAHAVVELDGQDWIRVRRELRKLARSLACTAAAPRYDLTGEYVGHFRVAVPGARRVRSRVMASGGSLTGGFVLVNDGISVAWDLARFLAAGGSTWKDRPPRARASGRAVQTGGTG